MGRRPVGKPDRMRRRERRPAQETTLLRTDVTRYAEPPDR